MTDQIPKEYEDLYNVLVEAIEIIIEEEEKKPRALAQSGFFKHRGRPGKRGGSQPKSRGLGPSQKDNTRRNIGIAAAGGLGAAAIATGIILKRRPASIKEVVQAVSGPEAPKIVTKAKEAASKIKFNNVPPDVTTSAPAAAGVAKKTKSSIKDISPDIPKQTVSNTRKGGGNTLITPKEGALLRNQARDPSRFWKRMTIMANDPLNKSRYTDAVQDGLIVDAVAKLNPGKPLSSEMVQKRTHYLIHQKVISQRPNTKVDIGDIWTAHMTGMQTAYKVKPVLKNLSDKAIADIKASAVTTANEALGTVPKVSKKTAKVSATTAGAAGTVKIVEGIVGSVKNGMQKLGGSLRIRISKDPLHDPFNSSIPTYLYQPRLHGIAQAKKLNSLWSSESATVTLDNFKAFDINTAAVKKILGDGSREFKSLLDSKVSRNFIVGRVDQPDILFAAQVRRLETGPISNPETSLRYLLVRKISPSDLTGDVTALEEPQYIIIFDGPGDELEGAA